VNKRKPDSGAKFTDLPLDYIKMVSQVLNAHFEAQLKELGKLKKSPEFEVTGRIYPDEVLVAVSVVFDGEVGATTVYGGMDYDPKASAPKVDALLGHCVDAIGSLLAEYMEPKKMNLFVETTFTSFSSDLPLEWTKVDIEKRKVFLKVDRWNPRLERLTDEWLKKNDPLYEENKLREEEEAKELFVVGDEVKKKLH
jgi:hypothetical protein